MGNISKINSYEAVLENHIFKTATYGREMVPVNIKRIKSYRINTTTRKKILLFLSGYRC